MGLVLSGGGARAAYQVGVLRAIAERAPNLDIPIITGVSAGAINTVYLAGHRGSLPDAVAGLTDAWGRLTSEKIYGMHVMVLARAVARWIEQIALGRGNGRPRVLGMLDARPLRAFLAESIDFSGIDSNIEAGRLRAASLDATAYASGVTITFVHGIPGIPAWERAQRAAVRSRLTLDHVMASSAIPLAFPAVKLDGAFYCDGSVRQHYPLAPAIHLGARRILAIGSGSIPPHVEAPSHSVKYPSAAAAMGLLLNSVFLDALSVDAERLVRINRLIATLPARALPPDGLRAIELLMLRPSRDLGAIAVESSEPLPRTIGLLLRGLGGRREESAEFLSYLLFEPWYTARLIELGYSDTRAQWSAIERFLSIS